MAGTALLVVLFLVGMAVAQEEETACERQRQELIARRLPDAFIPSCAEDGSYEKVQCYNAFRPTCWCVDENGDEIDGTRVFRFDKNLNCDAPQIEETACQRERRELIAQRIPDAFIPSCAEDGSYEKVQCYNAFQPTCWCVDENGEEIDGTRVFRFDRSLNCDAPKRGSECERQRQTIIAQRLPDAFIPSCAEDGSFEKVQCYNAFRPTCWCVDENGDEIDGTRVFRFDRNLDCDVPRRVEAPAAPPAPVLQAGPSSDQGIPSSDQTQPDEPGPCNKKPTGLYPAPGDCAQYWQCLPDYAARRQCPDNLVWDDVNKVCTHGNSQDPACRIPATDEEFSCVHREKGGMYADPSDCTQYYTCQEWFLLLTCAPGTLYNTDTTLCQFAAEVDCQDRPSRRPEDNEIPQ